MVLLLTLSSCRYLKDRALDFVDIYRGSVGAGSVAGVRVKSLGLVNTGLMMGVKPNASALGLRYGRPYFFNQKDVRFDADQAELFKATNIVNLDYTKGSYDSASTSVALLPAVFSWTDSTPSDFEWRVPGERDTYPDYQWVWSGVTARENRYAQIHAFDVEFEIGLVVYLEVGFSPGELLDFLLGLFTIDIAKDDGRLE